jgi:hypothetical protein
MFHNHVFNGNGKIQCRFVASLKLEEEKDHRSPLLFYAVSVADGAVACILDRTVVLDVADGAITAVLDRPITFYVSHCPVTGILYRAITFYVADGAVAGVLNRAVTFDMPLGGVAAVLDGAVTFDVACGGIAAVLNGLALDQCETQDGAQDKEVFFHGNQCSYCLRR